MSSKHHESDTEGSCDSSSTGATATGATVVANPPQPPPRGKTKKRSRRSEWEILEGLKDGQTYDRMPKKFEGFILKKRKWPMKGYHKRYFMLEKGVIVYGKSGWDIARGKVHGTLDTGLSVITTKPRDGRIDIDAEDCIYHLKIKPKEAYMEWLEQLKQHRLYRQHVLSFKELSSPAEESLPTSPSGDTNNVDKELAQIERDLKNLQSILDSINTPTNAKEKREEDNKNRDFLVLAKEVMVSLHHVRGVMRAANMSGGMGAMDGGTLTLRHALNQALQQNSELKSRLARIHRDSSFETSTFVFATNTDTIKSYSSSISNSEYYDAMDNHEDRTSSDEESFSSEGGEADSVNSETSEPSKLPTKLDLAAATGNELEAGDCNMGKKGAASSEFLEQIAREERRSKLPTPAPSGNEVPSLWGILRKNIGKDLSRISMPVALNEPLGVLQRMCEELEYSELLDCASKEVDPVERMALVAAFAVSGYATGFYRTQKPFNPLLGETFECVREDKGFRFISEQVSHHPPVSACHAEGRGWVFWAEIQPKTKFWGKSMEIQPIGENHLVLSKWNEHYAYNKATTCVHNVFSPPNRWVDLYGEVSITSGILTCNLSFVKASYWSAKKNEVVGSIVSKDGTTLRNLYGQWNEAFYSGQPPSAKCLWRLANMPDDCARYYGFSRFAIELNELTPSLKDKIPITDTRYRPDQRLLEEGKLSEAEAMKLQIEQRQRDRRKKSEEGNSPIKPLWFRKSNIKGKTGEELWEFTGTYWESRKAGFKTISLEKLW